MRRTWACVCKVLHNVPTYAACMNFVNALEKIPGIIAQYEERTAKLKADVPTLEGIMSKKWGKEDELKQLKSDLAALDRKIQAEIAPKHEEADGVENKQAESNTTTESNTIEAPSTGAKKSMVAEPTALYNIGAFHRGTYRPAGL